MKFKLYLMAISILGLIELASCKKFVDIPAPKNQLVSSKVFADSLDANSSIVGIYIDMYQSFGFSFASGSLTAYPGLSADEFTSTTNDPELNQFFDNKLDKRNFTNQNLWSAGYKYIYEANACIEGITKSKITQTAKNKLIGEAKQIRALVYFYLVNIYGPVPLVRSTDYHVNQTLARAPIDSVYAQILNDLTYAQQYLPKTGSAERANYYSANALLSKVQLYKQNYAAAETAATAVIGSGQYHLETDINNVFLANSNELIWKILPVFTGFETWEGYNFVPSDPNAVPQYVLTNDLYNSFEIGDKRKADWTNTNLIGGVTYPYPYKYKAATTSGTPTENYNIIRLGELYLIRAEARANLNEVNAAQADVNAVRSRAGLGNTSANDKASLLSAIEKERRTELFCEWGNRWFDLKRTNRSLSVLASSKPNLTITGLLYPIPDGEIKANSSLSQNAGY